MTSYSYPKSKIKILLLEGVHQSAVDYFTSQGYENIDARPGGMNEDELADIIGDYHFLGIRSRTQVTATVLEKATKLMGVGCFCIGTNQVDLEAAAQRAIPVFNAPYSNTRSVAELVLAEAILLLRGIPEKNAAAHVGGWMKTAENSFEARGKTFGIVGYGHIGSQVGVLAEALGFNVVYYDVVSKLPFGKAQKISSLEELLSQSEVVSLHVPQTDETKNLIGEKEIQAMKKGSYLLNASRGNVVVIEALVEALKSKHVLGAAIDVFPVEPKSKTEEFVSPLRDFENVILTPHIGGSTLEAQENIGVEVATKLVSYCDTGATTSAVNFAQVDLPPQSGRHRILHIHENRPGVLRALNDVFSDFELNIAGQYLQTKTDTGYVITDVDNADGLDLSALKEALKGISGTIKSRILY